MGQRFKSIAAVLSGKPLLEICWSLYFFSLFLPLSWHVWEQDSFWSGQFSAFTTIAFSPSFFFLGAALLLSAIHRFSGKLAAPRIPLWPLLYWTGLTLLALASLWMHGPSPGGIRQLLHWMLIGTGIQALFGTSLSLRPFLRILIVGIILEAFLGIAQTLSGFFQDLPFAAGAPVLKSSYGEIVRATGTFDHPNILAFVLLCGFFFSELLEKRWRAWRYLFLLAAIFTFSRSAFLVMLIAAVWLFFQKSWPLRRDSFLLIGVAAIGFFSRFFLDAYSPSDTERVSQLADFWELFVVDPFMRVGFGNFPQAAAAFTSSFPWQLQPLHNLFLLWGVETGILGLFLLLLLVVWTGKTIWTLSPSFSRSVLSKIFVIVAVFGFFDHLLLTSSTAIGFLICFYVLLFHELTERQSSR